ncbi:DAZ-associated protein 2-like isoform X1 [Gigantopelta aegis]|uniref:DAZ-associated protein 2-like isoform X1 n=1 Tax=Gigantopelta aegis TaxID=1735272 RepID=UPI001B88C394|nr:DAZ-associated protein 2-like isoform X1 [Gigantopelta aegis]
MSKSGYPRQQTAPNPYLPSGYPAQPPPYTPPAGYGQPMYQPSHPAYMYGIPGPKQSQPPPYTNAQPAAQSMPMAPPAAPLPTNVPGAYPQAQYQQFQPPVVMAGNIYDSGARFDGVAQPSIPPPPPGYAPSGAQMAAMHGNAVVGTQQQAGWLTGGSGGGMTLW